MAASEQEEQSAENQQKGRWFTTTCWTDLMAAQEGESPQAQEALGRLCNTYWYPLYAYIRRQGRSSQDAEDLTQSFFYQILKKNYLGAVDRKKGKFRSFLLASLNHFLSNERAFRNAEKRGGGKILFSLDEQLAEQRFRAEPATNATPEKMYELQWADTVLTEARQRLQGECEVSGKGELFEALKDYIMEDAASGDYHSVAGALKMTPGAIAVTVHRLRQRLGKILKEEVSQTVASPEETETELRHLCKVYGSLPASILNPDQPFS